MAQLTKLFLPTILTIVSINYSAQNTLPLSGNVGVGTVTPACELEVHGNTDLKGGVVMRDCVKVEKTLIVDQDVKIKGESIFVGNAKAKQDMTVIGITKMKGDAFVNGEFKFKGLQDLNLVDDRFLMIKPNGKVEVFEKAGLINLLYEPQLCLTKPDGNYYAPTWSGIDGVGGNDGILYTADNCPGKVGIGTNAPIGKLDVRGATYIGSGMTNSGTMLSINQEAPNKNGLDVFFTSTSPTLTGIGINTVVDKDLRVAFNVRNEAVNRNVFSVQGDGKVTINGTSPHSLEIKTNNFNNACVAFYPQSDQSDLLYFDRANNLRGVFRQYIENGHSVYTWDDRSGGSVTELMKLSSDGILYAHEIKVKTGTFPDYVFDDTYKLLSVKEVEEFISKNGRLPNMPAADEVIENGMAVGEIEVKLVEKVEELTLYIIALEKKMNALQSEIDAIK